MRTLTEMGQVAFQKANKSNAFFSLAKANTPNKARNFRAKKSSLIMDKERPKCFHNGIILIVNSFKIVTTNLNTYKPQKQILR
jgi:hypothetical protein